MADSHVLPLPAPEVWQSCRDCYLSIAGHDSKNLAYTYLCGAESSHMDVITGNKVYDVQCVSKRTNWTCVDFVPRPAPGALAPVPPKQLTAVQQVLAAGKKLNAQLAKKDLDI